MQKRVIEVLNDERYEITFDGFDEFTQFKEVMRILIEDLKVDEIKITGLDAMDGYVIKNGIRTEWNFNNWDGIMMTYWHPKKLDDIAILQTWRDFIFCKLISKFN